MLRRPFALALALLVSSCSSSSSDGPAANGTGGAGGTGGSGAAGGGGTSGAGGAGGSTSPPAWQTIFDKTTLGRAVLSIWGTGPADVYAVGGPLGNSGLEALALHYDGTSFRDLHAGGADGFWWVHGSGPKDVWMVGEHGRATRWDGAAFVETPTGTTATLYGVWAASPTEAWAVGGGLYGTMGDHDVVLRWDGTTWKAEAVPMPQGVALFKVWGTSSTDLYVVGEGATIWHRGAAGWEKQPAPGAQGTLLTVNGCSATDVWAVGDKNVFHSDGSTWSKVTVDLNSRVNGVACSSPGEIALVGFGGLKQRLHGGSFVDEFAIPPFVDLHGVWADGAGAYWAGGGDFIGAPQAGKPREGVIARWGSGTIAPTLAP
jgi:hypothetical protein